MRWIVTVRRSEREDLMVRRAQTQTQRSEVGGWCRKQSNEKKEVNKQQKSRMVEQCMMGNSDFFICIFSLFVDFFGSEQIQRAKPPVISYSGERVHFLQRGHCLCNNIFGPAQILDRILDRLLDRFSSGVHQGLTADWRQLRAVVQSESFKPEGQKKRARSWKWK